MLAFFLSTRIFGSRFSTGTMHLCWSKLVCSDGAWHKFHPQQQLSQTADNPALGTYAHIPMPISAPAPSHAAGSLASVSSSSSSSVPFAASSSASSSSSAPFPVNSVFSRALRAQIADFDPAIDIVHRISGARNKSVLETVCTRAGCSQTVVLADDIVSTPFSMCCRDGHMLARPLRLIGVDVSPILFRLRNNVFDKLSNRFPLLDEVVSVDSVGGVFSCIASALRLPEDDIITTATGTFQRISFEFTRLDEIAMLLDFSSFSTGQATGRGCSKAWGTGTVNMVLPPMTITETTRLRDGCTTIEIKATSILRVRAASASKPAAWNLHQGFSSPNTQVQDGLELGADRIYNEMAVRWSRQPPRAPCEESAYRLLLDQVEHFGLCCADFQSSKVAAKRAASIAARTSKAKKTRQANARAAAAAAHAMAGIAAMDAAAVVDDVADLDDAPVGNAKRRRLDEMLRASNRTRSEVVRGGETLAQLKAMYGQRAASVHGPLDHDLTLAILQEAIDQFEE